MDSNKARNKTQTIAVNSLWYGSETLAGFVLFFATSIPLARTLGPEKLGYFNYVAWLTAMSSSLGGLGIPAMSAKFMAEYLGRGERGIVRSIFFISLRLQIFLSLGVTVLALAGVLLWGDPAHRVVTILQVLSVLPAMVTSIPSMSNMAHERMSANFAGSVAFSAAYLVGVVSSLAVGWGLAGVAGSLLVGRTLELVIKLVPCVKNMRTIPAAPLSASLKKQMTSFAQKQVILLLLGLIIWDRSDIVLLKLLAQDIRQVTFFSIVFNLTEKILILPRVFGGAVSASVMVQFGQDSEKTKTMTASAARYMYLVGAPLFAGMALVSPSLIRVLYGRQYEPAIPVLAIAALFAILKTILDPADSIMRANNRQGPAVVCAIFCAILNVALDWLLIPGHGAAGAAIGNGVAQSALVISYWIMSIMMFGIPLDFRAVAKVTLASLAMAPVVMLGNHLLPALPGLIAGVVSGALTFIAVLAATSFFQSEDYARLGHLGRVLPRVCQPAFSTVLSFLVPASAAGTDADS